MEEVWKESVLPAARCLAKRDDLSQCSAEQRCIWRALPGPMQEELIAFAAAKLYEDAKLQPTTDALLKFCEHLFTESHEAHVVRPLCLLLGYVKTGAVDFLRTSAQESSILVFIEKHCHYKVKQV